MKSQIKKALTEAVIRQFGGMVMPEFLVETPENPAHGDYASNIALMLAKKLRRNPLEVAKILAEDLETQTAKLSTTVEVVPPGFINFFLDKKIMGENLRTIIKQKEKFGQGKPTKKTIVVEYSSPNIAKPLGIHHLRTTVIGQALVNILRFVGHKAISLSFPGDWGTQFGLLIAGYKRWGNPKKIKQNPIP